MSDTHAENWAPSKMRLPPIDVAIHCGDLTEESKIDEFRAALKMLSNVDAPLKLVIAGNHDFTLDTPFFKEKMLETKDTIEPELWVKEFGHIGEAQQLFEDAKSNGIVFLDQGIHRFNLQNGAQLTVYASPYTASISSNGNDWGFQFSPHQGQEFTIEDKIDIAITHGPPKGILDRTISKVRAGSQELFAAIARSRPLLHCFGHIHGGWGAKYVTWRDETTGEMPSHFTSIDNDKSAVIETLSSLRPTRFDIAEMTIAKKAKEQGYIENGYCKTSHCIEDDYPLQRGQNTLFVNASIQSIDGNTMQLPWVVEIELPRGETREKG